MNRKAFLLGFFAIGGQTLLLRELISSLNGDELFVGTALFGWLAAVALGAYRGGKSRSRLSPNALLVTGIILLPFSIIAVRLSPLVVTSTVGQIVPFTVAAALSIVLMLPSGYVAGRLFPATTKTGYFATESVIQVYLFEGIGAFTGGVVLTILVGSLLTTLGMALLVAVIVMAGINLHPERRVPISSILIIVALLIAIRYAVPVVDGTLDRVKYESFSVTRSFDTHYTHEALIGREASVILLTDNTVEATWPDLMTAENLLIPALLYRPLAEDVLFIGRAEFGVAQLARKIPGVDIIGLDPRAKLTEVVNKAIDSVPVFTTMVDDPVGFARTSAGAFDVIIIDPGELNSYRNSRLLTQSFLQQLRKLADDSGIVVFPSRYDTDRYVSPEVKDVLGIIYRTFAESFDTVIVWPGEMTIFFGFTDSRLAVPYDTAIARTTRLPFQPTYISGSYLYDRFDDLRTQRLNEALSAKGLKNTVDRPILTHYQAIYRSPSRSMDHRLLALLFGRSIWLILIPLFILTLFITLVRGGQGTRRFSLFLYFTAGAVSLSLELTSFYVYQTLAGSLFSELAILIGSFMLGLALGTFYASKIRNPALAFPALILLTVAALLFMLTYGLVATRMLLVYHLLFQFTVALATGTLFVAATTAYYPVGTEENQGTGYAAELLGSALGALATTSLLLPLIGLQWVLVAISALAALALFGTALVWRRSGAAT